MPILLTGFTSFGDVDVNPSQLIVEQLKALPGVVTAVLPVDYTAVDDCLAALLAQHQPEAVVCLGVARGRDRLNLERIALNLDDAGAPDNAGVTRRGLPIIAGAPLAYASTLPLEAMHARLEAASIPVTISNHAGAYLCNHAFFLTRHLTGDIPCGFIHVPALRSEANPEGLPLGTMVEAVRLCLEALAN